MMNVWGFTGLIACNHTIRSLTAHKQMIAHNYTHTHCAIKHTEQLTHTQSKGWRSIWQEKKTVYSKFYWISRHPQFKRHIKLTCRVTSTGFCLAEDPASSSTKRTVLQMRSAMKIMGMSVSFISATEEKECDWGLLAKMGRYSDRAACCIRQRYFKDMKHKIKNKNKVNEMCHQILFSQFGSYLRKTFL